MLPPNCRQLWAKLASHMRCKIVDCVGVCPADCFYEGENMLVIHPDECIDCGVCVPECPVTRSSRTPIRAREMVRLNAEFAKVWPSITMKKPPPSDSKDWEGKPDKFKFFLPNPGAGEADSRYRTFGCLQPPLTNGRRLEVNDQPMGVASLRVLSVTLAAAAPARCSWNG